MKQVLVVEDHAIVRAGIRRLLDERGDIDVLEVATGEAALAEITSRDFALVILDLNLPGLAGLELLRRIVRLAPGLPVLIFSQHTEAIYATRALETGARGFVSKNAKPEELLCLTKTPAGTEIVTGDRHPALRDWHGEVGLGVLFGAGVLS